MEVIPGKETEQKIMNDIKEEKLLAKGLKAPGAILLVKRRLADVKARYLRIIVTGSAVAEELLGYFDERGSRTEIDRAGDDYHVIVDMKNFKDVD